MIESTDSMICTNHFHTCVFWVCNVHFVVWLKGKIAFSNATNLIMQLGLRVWSTIILWQHSKTLPSIEHEWTLLFCRFQILNLLRTLLILEVVLRKSATVELTKLIASLDKFPSRIALSVVTPSHHQVMGQLSMSLSTRFWGTFSMSLHNLRPFSLCQQLPSLWQQRHFLWATVDIFSMERVTFKYCNFTRSDDTALSLVDSNLVLEGSNL